MIKAVKTEIGSSGLFSIIINRPEQRNAVNYQVMDEIDNALKEAEINDNVKALMFTGEGDQAFCSGGDLKEFQSLITAIESYGMLSKMGEIVYKLLTFPKPTIAFINGTAIGGGCEIAAACDFRIAVPTAKVGFVQGNLGITTGWGGASILYEKLPIKDALTLLFGGEIVSAEKAKQMNFIDYLINDKDSEDWDRVLARFLDKEAGVLMAYKKLLVKKWESSLLKKRILDEIQQCSKLWETEAHHKAVKRFIET